MEGWRKQGDLSREGGGRRRAFWRLVGGLLLLSLLCLFLSSLDPEGDTQGAPAKQKLKQKRSFKNPSTELRVEQESVSHGARVAPGRQQRRPEHGYLIIVSTS